MIDTDETPQGVTDTGAETPQEDNAASEAEEQSEVTSEPSPDSAEESKEEPETTDRGTKVAKEPESKFYQQIKNENADMRRLLGDPTSLKEYLKEFEGAPASKDGTEQQDELGKLVEQATLPTGQVDALKLAKLMDERTMKKIDEGMQFMSTNMERSQKWQRAYDQDKADIRQDHPELDPRKKDQFDPDLDQFIGERFVAQGGLQGKVSLKEVVDNTFSYLEKRSGAARKDAETEIVRKRAGAISQSNVSGKAADDEADMSPEQILAKRVRSQLQQRR